MLKKNKLTAERIKKVRKEKGMTQDELAAAAGYSGKAAIARIESGDNGISLEKLLALAVALDVSPDYLSGATDYRFDATGRPAANALIARISNPDCYIRLTDAEIDKLTYLLNNPGQIDIDCNNQLIEMLSNKEISEGERSAVIRYGNPYMKGNQCEYSVYLSNSDEPIIIFKCYINRYEPTMMLKFFKVKTDAAFGIENAVMNELIKISELFMLTKFYVGDQLINDVKISCDDDDYAAGEKFFKSFDYDNMKLEINK